MVIFHVTDEPAPKPEDGGEVSDAERDHFALRAMLEKRTIIRVLEAYGPAIKHHLRSEQYVGCFPHGLLTRAQGPVLPGEQHALSRPR